MAELLGEVIERKRGDTAPDKITVLDSENNNAPLDNTGFEYRLTVNTAKDPEPVGPPIVGSELLQSVGVPGGADGTVLFPFTVAQANKPAGCYWYDIEQKDTGGLVKTIAKNQYLFFMDVGKTN
ncbi:MAG: hypothetical protein KAI41_07285 [Hyphomicrobiaceae bacterium]|jgi:hypothetical protein|nr:hypothetical protein [Hyphomicrobiaceae bacterium]MCK5550318.1 hypothetical protein [Hyphomicrobiaceae bacterium]